jgi:hypothetical protein
MGWKETAMAELNIEVASDELQKIIAGLKPGGELVFTANGVPVAKVVRLVQTSWPCKAGSAKDTDHWMAPDFDAPLEDFKEYMG